jgi:hypothetical protein
MAWLETFCKDWGFPANRERMICEQCPSDNFPEGACPCTLSNMLDLFEAQLLRFSRLLRFKRSPVRAGGKRIFESCDFKKARINQFTWQLDSGSLATWSLVLRKLLTDPAKARDFDISWQGERGRPQIRDAAFFVEWNLRISQYPTGPGLFRDVACTVGAGEQFDTFYSAARDLHDLVSNGELRVSHAGSAG